MTQLKEVKGQIVAKPAIFQLYIIIFKKKTIDLWWKLNLQTSGMECSKKSEGNNLQQQDKLHIFLMQSDEGVGA